MAYKNDFQKLIQHHCLYVLAVHEAVLQLLFITCEHMGKPWTTM